MPKLGVEEVIAMAQMWKTGKDRVKTTKAVVSNALGAVLDSGAIDDLAEAVVQGYEAVKSVKPSDVQYHMDGTMPHAGKLENCIACNYGEPIEAPSHQARTETESVTHSGLWKDCEICNPPAPPLIKEVDPELERLLAEEEELERSTREMHDQPMVPQERSEPVDFTQSPTRAESEYRDLAENPENFTLLDSEAPRWHKVAETLRKSLSTYPFVLGTKKATVVFETEDIILQHRDGRDWEVVAQVKPKHHSDVLPIEVMFSFDESTMFEMANGFKDDVGDLALNFREWSKNHDDFIAASADMAESARLLEQKRVELDAREAAIKKTEATLVNVARGMGETATKLKDGDASELMEQLKRLEDLMHVEGELKGFEMPNGDWFFAPPGTKTIKVTRPDGTEVDYTFRKSFR